MLKKIVILLLFVVSAFAANIENHTKQPVVIFASANNKFVLPELLKGFSMKYPDAKVVVQYGATGDLASAILDGVDYGVFLSADMKRAQMVYAAKKSATKPRKYAEGVLVLFTPADKTLNERKLNVLKSEKIKHITIANKKTAPYGKAAMQALENSGMYKKIDNKVRYSTDISTAITNVIWYDDAGFLSKSGIHTLPLGYRKEGVNWIEVDPSLYEPIIQGFVVSEQGMQHKHTKDFVEYMLSEEGRNVYKEYGYK